MTTDTPIYEAVSTDDTDWHHRDLPDPIDWHEWFLLRGWSDRDPVPAATDNEQMADLCTCGLAEQERTGHHPEHSEWCDAWTDWDAEVQP